MPIWLLQEYGLTSPVPAACPKSQTSSSQEWSCKKCALEASELFTINSNKLSNNASVLFQHIRASETHSIYPTVGTKLARPPCFHMWSERLLRDFLSSLLSMCHSTYEDIWEFLFSDLWPLALSRAAQIRYLLGIYEQGVQAEQSNIAPTIQA